MYGQLNIIYYLSLKLSKKETVTGDGAALARIRSWRSFMLEQVTVTSFFRLLGSKSRLLAKHLYACLDLCAAGKVD